MLLLLWTFYCTTFPPREIVTRERTSYFRAITDFIQHSQQCIEVATAVGIPDHRNAFRLLALQTTLEQLRRDDVIFEATETRLKSNVPPMLLFGEVIARDGLTY